MYEGSTEFRRRQLLQMQQQQREAQGHTKKRKQRGSKAPRTVTQPPQDEAPHPMQGVENGLSNGRDTQSTLRSEDLMTSNQSASSSQTFMPSASMSTPTMEAPAASSQHLRELERLEATFFNPFGLPRVSLDIMHTEKGILTGAYYLLDHFCKKLPTWMRMMPLVQDLEVSGAWSL